MQYRDNKFLIFLCVSLLEVKHPIISGPVFAAELNSREGQENQGTEIVRLESTLCEFAHLLELMVSPEKQKSWQVCQQTIISVFPTDRSQ